jgi:hypothetical protein
VQLNAIISQVLAGPGCRRLLAGDGITAPELSIKVVPGVFDAASVDVRSARKSMPAIGQAASIAKNLDEYQFLICSLVPSLPDTDPHKLHLQKYRVAAVAAFVRLSAILKEPSPESLEQWNAHAGPLMEETSEAYVKAKSNAKLQVASHKEAFEFFGVPQDRIDAALRAFYGR